MILEQILTRDLGCAAYVVGCDHAGEAIVVDPPLHVQPVLDVCDRNGLRLVGVIETHTHADHVSGHGILASRLGTWIATHPLGRPEYPSRAIADGDRIELGRVALDVLHTPGHRPEHCCIAVSDLERSDDPWILLTGDSLFVGDIARPDLAVAGSEGAEGLYRSLHERLAGLSDGVEVFPGHVAGSACGRAMSARLSTTLGFERHHNRMLAAMPSSEFVRLANEGLSPKPPTMGRVVELNRGPLIEREPAAARVSEVPDGAQLLDVRPAIDVAAGYVAGAIAVPVSVSGFANRAGFVLDPEQEVTVLAHTPHEGIEAVRLLAAVGFDRLSLIDTGVPVGAELARFRVIAGNGARRHGAAGARRARARRAGRDGARRGLHPLPRARRRRSLGARSRTTRRDRLQLGRARIGRGEPAGASRLPRRPARARGRDAGLPLERGHALSSLSASCSAAGSSPRAVMPSRPVIVPAASRAFTIASSVASATASKSGLM